MMSERRLSMMKEDSVSSKVVAVNNGKNTNHKEGGGGPNSIFPTYSIDGGNSEMGFNPL
jgi:hypothetical protein